MFKVLPSLNLEKKKGEKRGKDVLSTKICSN